MNIVVYDIVSTMNIGNVRLQRNYTNQYPDSWSLLACICRTRYLFGICNDDRCQSRVQTVVPRNQR